MSLTTFTWTLDFGAQDTRKPTTSKIKFGDGYAQRASYGLNTDAQSWAVAFNNRDKTQADAIEAFLATAGGITPFFWTPPDSSTRLLFICEEWTRSLPISLHYNIQATFDQVFDPMGD